ncbi:hypothetical protein Smp_051000 [Schistosoma mansoni]|uniref:hypothetical protein n=1 Tax=Schistosoma mansoni TaxID=6183 RepID=UPI0001A63F12|nr:hypothetical protein Smp_051000 [Schistosoma mansoni]|eukprot:XP_018653301.1 hypothetical protein Smp_051000 [Schistosoma mansoni]
MDKILRLVSQNIAGPNCRELSKLKLRLLALDRQNKAVSRRVSELVLEKHPQYEAELKGVLSLQSDNWETLCMCREIRKSIHSKLKASELRIDEKLDSELQRSCEHFDEKSYSTVQRAFELLGSTQTTFAQLQMHYVAAIQRKSFYLVQFHVHSASQSDTSGNKIITNYSYPELCQSSETYPSASSHTKHKSFTSNSLLSNSKYHKPKLKVDNNDRDDIVVTTEIDQDSSTVTKSYVNINNDHGCDPQLARQWHDYVTCKLDSGRSRIWSEIISRIEPILNLVSQFARDMTFDQIASLLSTINHFVHIGEEFCECSPNELLEALRISIQKYFKDFHRKHMDRLKMFLENETWKICPVKHSFTVMDLQSNDTSFSNEHSGPLLSTTTLEVLRLIGRYLQMMRLLQPIAGEVMHCLCQVFDYYLYSISNSSEFPERLRTTIKRINERLITADNHQTWGSNAGEFNGLAAFRMSLSSVQVLLPHLTACLPDNKRGLALVFREQSLMAARQIREPCANELAPHLLNIIITKMTDVTAKNCKQLPATNNAPITSSFSKIWPIGSNTNQQQQTIDKESSIPNNNNTNSSSPTSIHNNLIVSTTDSIDILTMHICAMNWLTKEVANTPNSYVYDININVFHPLSLILQNISKEFHLKDHIFMIVIWKALLSCLASQLLEALSRVQQCSDEGRGQMLLDIQTLAVYAQSASKIRSFPRLDYVIEYIQAFYIPIHEWEHWLTNYGTKYSRSQLTGLASCLSRSDKRQYQRLINTLNQIYNTTNQINSFGNGLLTTTSS